MQLNVRLQHGGERDGAEVTVPHLQHSNIHFLGFRISIHSQWFGIYLVNLFLRKKISVGFDIW